MWRSGQWRQIILCLWTSIFVLFVISGLHTHVHVHPASLPSSSTCNHQGGPQSFSVSKMLTLCSPERHFPGGMKYLPNDSFKMCPLCLTISEGTMLSKWLQSPVAKEEQCTTSGIRDACYLPSWRFPVPSLVGQSPVGWGMPPLLQRAQLSFTGGVSDNYQLSSVSYKPNGDKVCLSGPWMTPCGTLEFFTSVHIVWLGVCLVSTNSPGGHLTRSLRPSDN